MVIFDTFGARDHVDCGFDRGIGITQPTQLEEFVCSGSAHPSNGDGCESLAVAHSESLGSIHSEGG